MDLSGQTPLSSWQLPGPEAATAGQPHSASLYGVTKLNQPKARSEAAGSLSQVLLFTVALSPQVRWGEEGHAVPGVASW